METENSPSVENLGSQAIIYDLDGTIIEDGAENPKTKAIYDLESIVEASNDMISSLDAGSLDKLKEKIIADEKYFKRYCSSKDEVNEAPDHVKQYIFFEGLKDMFPEIARHLQTLMAGGIATGKYRLAPYVDAVESIQYFEEQGYKIGIYSGGSSALQELMLSRIPVDGDSNIADLVKEGAGFHTVKEFGNKTRPESYAKAARLFLDHGLSMSAYITDSIGEALACRIGAPNANAIYIARGDIKQASISKAESNGITVITDLRQVKVR